MKRMSEFFELPVSVFDEDETGFDGSSLCAVDTAGYYNGAYFYDERNEYAEAVAHAINNVDALADSLKEITDDYFIWCGDDPDLTTDQCHKLHQMMIKAKAALAAYRGEK